MGNKVRGTIKQKKAVKNIIENGGNISKGMVDAGYSRKTAINPSKLTKSKGWEELIKTYLPDDLITEKHNELLNASGVGHMVFPLDATDDQIVDLLRQANCIVKKFMHSENQTHVWYFAPDNNARKAAIDMAYKLKGRYSEEKKVTIENLADIILAINNGRKDNKTTG